MQRQGRRYRFLRIRVVTCWISSAGSVGDRAADATGTSDDDVIGVAPFRKVHDLEAVSGLAAPDPLIDPWRGVDTTGVNAMLATAVFRTNAYMSAVIAPLAA